MCIQDDLIRHFVLLHYRGIRIRQHLLHKGLTTKPRVVSVDKAGTGEEPFQRNSHNRGTDYLYHCGFLCIKEIPLPFSIVTFHKQPQFGG